MWPYNKLSAFLQQERKYLPTNGLRVFVSGDECMAMKICGFAPVNKRGIDQIFLAKGRLIL